MGRDYRAEYDNYHSKPAQKKKRASRNAARRKLEAGGRVQKGSDMDVHHVDGNPLNNSPKNLRAVHKSKNRSFARTSTGRKKRS
jgi:hypothetical protein|tara:strand:+ start:457 stop:708 length:252 start_codon:yes stop_codon:yes gene_type:complete